MPKQPRTGVLLMQLGTPDDASVPAVRRYLAEFLADPRIIEANRVLWWLILHGYILRTRPRSSAAKYQRLLKQWGRDDGMPLLHYTQRQAEMLQAALGPGFDVRFAMRYGNPNLRAVIPEITRAGWEHFVAVPMYPQYSATSTASAVDGLYQALMRERRVPAATVVPPYYDHPAFIEAQAKLIEDELAKLPWAPDHYILTYHGIPRSYAQKGDPYATHVERTTQALVRRLGWRKGQWSRTYQSLFGREKWLGPYTEDKLKALAAQGKTKVFLASPGFTADCLETIDELGHEANEVFTHAGGERLHRCPCLNDAPLWIEALRQIVLAHIPPVADRPAAPHRPPPG